MKRSTRAALMGLAGLMVAVCSCLRSYGHCTPGRTSNSRTTSTGLAFVLAGSDRMAMVFSFAGCGRSEITVSAAGCGRDPAVASGGSLERDGGVSGPLVLGTEPRGAAGAVRPDGRFDGRGGGFCFVPPPVTGGVGAGSGGFTGVTGVTGVG